MSSQVVTARGGRIGSPYIVALEPEQREPLVQLALNDPGYTGIAARTHFLTNFYVWDRPVGMGAGAPGRGLQVGYFARFGGALFYDDPRPLGDNSPTTEDWAWLALRPRPLADVPAVYFDQESGTAFPPRCVMPLDELRELVLDFVNTGERPRSVDWLTVNDLHWKLDAMGEIAGSTG
jgi:hypothetical protein